MDPNFASRQFFGKDTETFAPRNNSSGGDGYTYKTIPLVEENQLRRKEDEPMSLS